MIIANIKLRITKTEWTLINLIFINISSKAKKKKIISLITKLYFI